MNKPIGIGVVVVIGILYFFILDVLYNFFSSNITIIFFPLLLGAYGFTCLYYGKYNIKQEIKKFSPFYLLLLIFPILDATLTYLFVKKKDISYEGNPLGKYFYVWFGKYWAFFAAMFSITLLSLFLVCLLRYFGAKHTKIGISILSVIYVLVIINNFIAVM